MPPPIDPALGLSGALTALQSQPPMAAAGAGGSAQGAGDLSRAARSLESVQGNVAGQTMAIQQMTMASQQQASGLNMLISQLSTQISGLNQAVSQLAMSQRMAATGAMSQQTAPMAFAPPAPPPPVMGGGGGFQMPTMGQVGQGARHYGGMALGAMMTVGGGLHTAGSALGRAGAAAASPFMGTPVYNPGAGQFGPQIAPNTGMVRGMSLATGLGIHPEMLQRGSAAQINELGREAFQERVSDLGMGITGGLAKAGFALGPDLLAHAGLSKLGYGFGASMLGGMAIAAPFSLAGGAAVDEIAGQAASIRGFGSQLSRNAFRFMPQSALGGSALRRPNMRQRNRFGAAMNRESIQDLMFNEQDMQEMFAGMSNQDLMRGVQNVDEVVQRFRETKETFRLIGQRMGQGLQEASGTIGALQGLGFDPTGQRGRSAIFGASSVLGLTPTEAHQRSAGFAGQFARQGTGREMYGAMNVSQDAAQRAIAAGTLSNVDISALGGREGAQGTLAGFMGAFLQSQTGKAALMAGRQGMGQGMINTIGLAGRRAGQDVNLLVDMQLGGEEQIREYMANPNLAMMDMYAKVSSLADVYEQGGTSRNNAMRMAIKNIAKQGGKDMTGAELTAMMKMFDPKEMEKRARQNAQAQVGLAAEDASTQLQLQTSVFQRAKRDVKSFFSPAAEGLVQGWERLGGRGADLGTDIQRALSGTERLDLGAGLDVETVSGLRARGGGSLASAETFIPKTELAPVGSNARARQDMHNARVQRRKTQQAEQARIAKGGTNKGAKRAADKIVSSSIAENRTKIRELKDEINDPGTTPDERRRLMGEIMDLASGGAYSSLSTDSESGAAGKLAFQQAVEQQLGLDPSGVFGGQDYRPVFSGAERERLKELQGDISSILGVSEDDAEKYARPEIQALVTALETSSGVDVALEAAKTAGLETEAERIMELSENKFADFRVGAFSLEDDMLGYATGRDLLGAFSKRMKEAGDLGNIEAQQNRLQQTGARAQTMLRQLRSKTGTGIGTTEVGAALGGGDAPAVLKNLQEMISVLGADEEALKGLESGEVAGGKRMAHIVRELRDIDLRDDGGKMTESEKERVAKLLGMDMKSEAFKKVVDDAQKAGDIGFIAAKAMDAQTPAGLKVLGGKEGRYTDQQLTLISQMMAQQQEMAIMLDNLRQHDVFRKK